MAYENGDESVIRFLTSKGAVLTALEFETFKLADGLHRLAYPWGMRNNLVVSTGPNGALIIDTGFNKPALDAIRKIVAGFGRGDIQYVINTHSHWDHVAGNALAPSESAVIGLRKLEDLAREGRLAASDRRRQAPGGKSLPAPYLMKFNSEELEIIPYPGLHSDEDILVHFPKARVLCMGDLLLSQSCPAEDMIRTDLLKSYKSEYSHLDWLGPDSWIQTVVHGLQSAGGITARYYAGPKGKVCVIVIQKQAET
jgi:glyoxylase-like metal-dependent hydrolase (beta-lactamase superfamily II)